MATMMMQEDAEVGGGSPQQSAVQTLVALSERAGSLAEAERLLLSALGLCTAGDAAEGESEAVRARLRAVRGTQKRRQRELSMGVPGRRPGDGENMAENEAAVLDPADLLHASLVASAKKKKKQQQQEKPDIQERPGRSALAALEPSTPATPSAAAAAVAKARNSGAFAEPMSPARRVDFGADDDSVVSSDAGDAGAGDEWYMDGPDEEAEEQEQVSSKGEKQKMRQVLNRKMKNALVLQLVDILNEGDASELCRLHGIGERRAAAIIEMRKDHDFTRDTLCDDLRLLPGVFSESHAKALVEKNIAKTILS